MTETVVITGASAGIGRATARLYAERGARILLVARGGEGLRAAADEVRALGGHPLVHRADVSDMRQVEAAAEAAEENLGPIDVWVNCAFATVFAPFTEITADEYRRVTDVTYHGFVNGTRAALTRMLPRDRGTIVQVGSALGERAVPLQSAYCGAKHAINGFTSALRNELMHRHSRVRVTVVQMPAVNTPQFSWVRSALPRHPSPVPPIYQPEVAARAVLHAADRPGRKQYLVGASTWATIWANRLAPAALDRYLARTGFDSQQTDSAETRSPETRSPTGHEQPTVQGNLFAPVDEAPGSDHGSHGVFDDSAHRHSWQAAVSRRRALLTATALTAAGALVAGVARNRVSGCRSCRR